VRKLPMATKATMKITSPKMKNLITLEDVLDANSEKEIPYSNSYPNRRSPLASPQPRPDLLGMISVLATSLIPIGTQQATFQNSPLVSRRFLPDQIVQLTPAR
jgi:hypothetical protein